MSTIVTNPFANKPYISSALTSMLSEIYTMTAQTAVSVTFSTSISATLAGAPTMTNLVYISGLNNPATGTALS